LEQNNGYQRLRRVGGRGGEERLINGFSLKLFTGRNPSDTEGLIQLKNNTLYISK
jgi:hypothetical protein